MLSVAVVLIGLAHGLPPLIGGLVFKAKWAVVLGAAIALLIAIETGSVRFVVADILGIFVGTWMGWVAADGKL
jgi:hypothetical protein